MKIKSLEQVKTKLDISEKTFVFLIFFSIIYLAGCLLLSVPAFRNLIIMFGEVLIRRPITHPVWHERFILWSFPLIVLYVIFLIIFFSENIFGGYLKKNKSLAYFFVAAFLLLGVFVILFQANWTFGDDHEYITTTVVNKYVPFYFGSRRFSPLGHFHYNIPLFIFRFLGIESGLPVEAHFTLIALFYAVTVICLFLLFNRIEPVKGHPHPLFSVFFTCTFFLLGRAFCSIFMSLIYPETQVLMLFSFFILMYYRALETDKKRYYIAALLAVIYSSYCKEPVFGALLVFAGSNLLFGYKKQSKRETVFYTALIANGILFIVLYYFISYKNATGFYNEGRVDIYGLQFIVSILRNNPQLIIMTIFAVLRFSAIIIKKDRDHLYYDSLLFAGTAYSFAYVRLHLNGSYYFMPSIILFLPSLVYWMKYFYQTKKHYALALFASIMFIWFFNLSAISDIQSKWRDRKEFIPYISNLLSEYNGGKQFFWYESDNAITDNMFYKARREFRKYVETTFLNYMNKSEGKEFFTTSKNMGDIGLYENVLFFSPVDNDQSQPMPDSLIKILADNNFELFTDSYGVLIYKQH
jgi:hypothetical protein